MRSLTTSAEILVVDDDDDFRDSCVDVLRQSGLHVLGLPSARDALGYLRTAAPLPALIVLDLMMPDINGWQFYEQQQRDQRLAEIPVLVVSASGTVAPPGFDEASFLSKLVDPETLIATVASRRRPPGRSG